MPADYSSAAAALALSPTPSPDPFSTSPTARDPPPWVRPSHGRHGSVGSRRLAQGPRRGASFSSASQSTQSAARRWLRTANTLAEQSWAFFLRLPLLHRVALGLALLVLNVLGILFLVYSHRIFAALGPVADKWRALPGGWVLLWLAIFVTAFPPMIGYSTCVTVAGFVYDFPWAWPLVASANVAGSTAAFVASRTVLSNYVHNLVGRDRRFVALGQVLRREGLMVLTGVRFAPLPYSLSNGFLATIPSVRPWAFALSTAFATPKLLIHVWIGSRLAYLAKDGDSMSAGDKAVNYIGMALGALVGILTGLFVYRRTMARAAELALEDPEDAAANGLVVRTSTEYLDEAGEDAPMIDPDAADLALGDDDDDGDADDISLWTNDGYDVQKGGAGAKDDAYRDREETPSGNGSAVGRFLDEEAAAVQGPGRR